MLGCTTSNNSWTNRPADRAQMIVVDEDGLRRLPGEIQMYRAALALVRGDTAATITHAHLAVDRAETDDHLTLASASALSGLAHWSNGDLEAAHHAYSACVVGLRRVGHISDVLGCSIALADIRITQGRLGNALRTYEQALQLAAEHGGAVPLRGTADLFVGMSQIAFERNDLDTAAELLRRSQELGEHTGLPQNRYRWRVSMARLRHAARRSARCAWTARRGGAAVHGRLLPERAAGRRGDGTAAGHAGPDR